MSRTARPARLLLAALALAAAPACLRTAPAVVLYTLEPLPATAADAQPAPAAGPAVEVLPVRLPEVLRRPQLLEARGTGRFGLLENHRWGNPLDQEVQRVLVADLAALLGGAPVVPSPYGARVGAAWQVQVDVQSWAAEPGQGLVLEATWMLIRPETGQAAVFRRSTLREPLAGPGPDALSLIHI